MSWLTPASAAKRLGLPAATVRWFEANGELVRALALLGAQPRLRVTRADSNAVAFDAADVRRLAGARRAATEPEQPNLWSAFGLLLGLGMRGEPLDGAWVFEIDPEAPAYFGIGRLASRGRSRRKQDGARVALRSALHPSRWLCSPEAAGTGAARADEDDALPAVGSTDQDTWHRLGDWLGRLIGGPRPPQALLLEITGCALALRPLARVDSRRAGGVAGVVRSPIVPRRFLAPFRPTSTPRRSGAAVRRARPGHASRR